jgi:hypothetical protein
LHINHFFSTWLLYMRLSHASRSESG